MASTPAWHLEVSSPCELLHRSPVLGWGGSPGWYQDMPGKMLCTDQDSGVLSFSRTALPQSVRPPRSASMAFKRRLESWEQEPTTKHFLSEEKMAARFNSLSLDNDHAYTTNGFPAHDADPNRKQWLQEYSRFRELEQRLSPDGVNEESDQMKNESDLGTVVVDGEFSMADSPIFTLSPILIESLRNAGPVPDALVPEQLFLSLNPCTELVLWSPPGNVITHTIRALMLHHTPSATPCHPAGCTLEGMEQ
uniref:Host cell factor C1 regulator 1 n=1 Tax=Sphenodon punctatus TaxID=8508 RepID=A0A8D0H2J5_SPHPU